MVPMAAGCSEPHVGRMPRPACRGAPVAVGRAVDSPRHLAEPTAAGGGEDEARPGNMAAPRTGVRSGLPAGPAAGWRQPFSGRRATTQG